jgi:cell division topological specificity factor
MSMKFLRLLGSRGPVTGTGTAPVARERLQILLAHERSSRGHPELLSLLRVEILAAVARHVELDPDRVTVRMQCGDDVSTLEVDIELPNDAKKIERRRMAG